MDKMKIFLMTRNERELIEDWIKYHAYLVGIENIHILDGSDDDFVLSVYERYLPKGLNVHFSNSSLDDLADELTELIHIHKETGNFLIKLDTDEFLAFSLPADLRPRNAMAQDFRREFLERFDGKGVLRINGFWNTLYDYSFRRRKLSLEGFEQFLSNLPVTGQRYKASLTVWSIPNEQYSPRPCYDVLNFTSPQFTHLKTFFHSDSFVSVDLGCHIGVSQQNEGFIDTGLTIIHYHSTSEEDAMRRAREVLRSHKYIHADDSFDQELEKLSVLEGQRISSYHKINLYLSWLKTKKAGASVSLDILNEQHPFYRSARPREMTLVRDTLQSISP